MAQVGETNKQKFESSIVTILKEYKLIAEGMVPNRIVIELVGNALPKVLVEASLAELKEKPEVVTVTELPKE